jgi:hypothetical protein
MQAFDQVCGFRYCAYVRCGLEHKREKLKLGGPGACNAHLRISLTCEAMRWILADVGVGRTLVRPKALKKHGMGQESA